MASRLDEDASTRPDRYWQDERPSERSTTSKRRRRMNTLSDSFARRKRASTACQFCRLRKTKCDNARPICGYCRDHGALCVYSDAVTEVGATENGHRPNGSAADAAPPREAEASGNSEILARLDEIKHLLQSSSANIPSQLQADPRHAASPFTPTTQEGMGPDHRVDPPSSHEAQFPHPWAATRCETLLSWPVFDDLVPPELASSAQSFVLGSQSLSDDIEDAEQHATPASPPRPAYTTKGHLGQGIPDDGFITLCNKFLVHVYPRNPVLKANELVQYARSVSENGLAWDAPSCLVLIVCALSSYTQPWGAPPIAVYDENIVASPSSEEDARATSVAEAYFMAAKKRIGLLGSSLIDIQCLFLASIYEKYAFRPLQSWYYLQQAANRLQARHWRKVFTLQTPSSGRTNRPSAYHLSQRLLWSCYKAENELVPELGLRPSCLEDLAGQDTFPAPPERLAQDSHDIGPSPPSDDAHSADIEAGWFFYLAEISLRRTISDTISLLYGKTENYWMNNPDYLLRQCAEAQTQIASCYILLPPVLRFDESGPPENEFSFYLQGRFGEWKDYVLRPLIYYAIHTTTQVRPEILALAQQGIDGCAAVILRNAHHQRHGGTWFVTRRMFSSALTILAVVIRAGDVVPPANWPAFVRLALTVLSRWSGECHDVEKMRQALEDLFARVCHRIGIE